MAAGKLQRRGPPRLAYVGADHQLHVVGIDGSGRRQVSWAHAPGLASGWGASTGTDSCSWPVWSPDGRWLACFRAQLEEGTRSRLSVVEVDGVEEREIVNFTEEIPLYVCWSPDGRGLGLLVQHEDQLELWACRPDRLGDHRVIEQGPPLFFSWLPDGSRIAIHAGGESGSRLIVRDALGAGEDVLLPGSPGTFCTPMVSRSRLLVAFDRGQRSVVASTSTLGEDLQELVEIDGLLALLPSPDGRWLALGSAVADQSPYRGLWRLRLDGPARPERITDRDCIAFFWLPDGQGLLTIEADEDQGCLWWHLHLPDTGDHRRVGSMRPTREMMFHLHFFEQFAESHPLVSPDGRFLVQASYADPHREGPQGQPRLERIDLADPHASFEPMAEGSYGVFAPP